MPIAASTTERNMMPFLCVSKNLEMSMVL
jgi:hypothetical protein